MNKKITGRIIDASFMALCYFAVTTGHGALVYTYVGLSVFFTTIQLIGVMMLYFIGDKIEKKTASSHPAYSLTLGFVTLAFLAWHQWLFMSLLLIFSMGLSHYVKKGFMLPYQKEQ